MLCQSCGKNTANTYIKTIVNGELTESRLCAQCAAQKGYSSVFGGLSFSNLIGSFFGGNNVVEMPAPEAAKRCEMCGSSFRDIVKSGKVGCAECYEMYSENLMPTIQRMHGNTKHTGKVPASLGSRYVLKQELEALRKKLQEAIAAQEFEDAAVIRDQIREKEKEAGKDE